MRYDLCIILLFGEAQGVVCVAYCPLGHSGKDLLANPEVAALAESVGRSPAQAPPPPPPPPARMYARTRTRTHRRPSRACLH